MNSRGVYVNKYIKKNGEEESEREVLQDICRVGR